MKQHEAKWSTRKRTQASSLLLWFHHPAVPARQKQEILEVLQPYTLWRVLRDSQCLGKKTKQSSLVWSLNHHKTAKEGESHGLPGNVTFTRPQHLPRTQRCPLPHQSKVAKNRQCNLSSLAKDLGRAVLHFQHTCASFEKVQRLLRALGSHTHRSF